VNNLFENHTIKEVKGIESIMKSCLREDCPVDNTTEVFIIATDWNRRDYITTYITHKGLTYNQDETDIFNTFEDAFYYFNYLLKGGRKVKDYFGDLTGRELSIIKVIKSISTNKICWNESKTVVKSVFI
jgi:hypothetical protein